MKIAIIAHSLYPIAEPFAGGLEKITQLLVNEFVEAGHEVTLLARVGSVTQAQLIPYPTEDMFDDEMYHDEHEWLGITREELYQIYVYNWAMNWLHHQDFDIIHNHSLHHVPIVRGVEFGKKYFTTFHTPIFTQLHFALKCNAHVIHTNQFTSVSRFQQQLYKEFTPSHLVYNGIEVDQWKYNINDKKDYVFWMGRICKEKAPHQAARACIEAGVELVIAGPISNEKYHEEHLKPLLNHDKIHFVGHLERDQINDYLIDAKAYLFTSTWDEPYGLTIAESLASGTPVIAYDVGAASEIITDDCGIIIPRESIPHLIEALGELDKIDLKKCRQRAEEFCNIKASAKDYLALYEQTI